MLTDLFLLISFRCVHMQHLLCQDVMDNQYGKYPLVDGNIKNVLTSQGHHRFGLCLCWLLQSVEILLYLLTGGIYHHEPQSVHRVLSSQGGGLVVDIL